MPIFAYICLYMPIYAYILRLQIYIYTTTPLTYSQIYLYIFFMFSCFFLLPNLVLLKVEASQLSLCSRVRFRRCLLKRWLSLPSPKTRLQSLLSAKALSASTAASKKLWQTNTAQKPKVKAAQTRQRRERRTRKGPTAFKAPPGDPKGPLAGHPKDFPGNPKGPRGP